MSLVRSPTARPPRAARPLGSLDGPSRTITVEPVQVPVPAQPPRVAPEPDRGPAQPPPARTPAPTR
jgi:hypothetical protein